MLNKNHGELNRYLCRPRLIQTFSCDVLFSSNISAPLVLQREVDGETGCGVMGWGEVGDEKVKRADNDAGKSQKNNKKD